jgi:hypothetical protein
MNKYNVTFHFDHDIQDFIVKHADHHPGRHVTGIVTHKNHVIEHIDNVIVTNGNYVMPLMQKLNIYVPIYPVKV